jgi:hypothetical protein
MQIGRDNVVKEGYFRVKRVCWVLAQIELEISIARSDYQNNGF